MSVWKTAHYRDEALQWGLRNIPANARDNVFFRSLADFEIEEFGDFPVPAGLKPGNLLKQLEEDEGLVNKLDSNTDTKFDKSIGKLVGALPKAVIGLRAVFRLAAHVLERVDEYDPNEETHEESKFYKQALRYGLAASNHSAKDYEARAKAINEAGEGALAKGEEWIKDILRLRGFSRSNSHRSEAFRQKALGLAYPAVEDRAKGKFKWFDIYSFPGATVYCPRLGYECWLLTSKDVERVERIVRGLLVSRLYVAFYASIGVGQRGRLLKAADKHYKLIVETMSSVGGGLENKVCRAWDVAYHMYIAKHIVKDDPRAEQEQVDKYRNEKLDRVVKAEAVHRCVTGLPPKEALEILSMYKCFPQPDFDYFGAAYRQREMYLENKRDADRNNAARGDMFREIMQYHKLTMIRSFHRRHGRCPGVVKDGVGNKRWHGMYPDILPAKLEPEDTDDIDLKGAFIWKERGTDVLDLVKDKAILPVNINGIKNGVDVRKTAVTKKNYLMDVISRQAPIDARSFGKKLVENRFDLDVRADDKAEAKKPEQRLFFELGSEPRMYVSMYEDSITDYAVHTVGCFSGKSQKDKLDTMNNITYPVSENIPLKALQISFDIKKFSPYLPDRVHRALDEQWAEAFGVPELKHMHKVLTVGKVHYVHGPIHHEFDKTGADFEGFFGKKLTLYHCAVMGYCVRQMRLDKLISQPGRFAALIDDGLLRINLPTSVYENRKKTVLELIERVYANAALRISWDKTYTSAYYATFLHENRIYGRSITAGLRAALKMTSRADVPVDSLPDDLGACSATAFGAMSSGAPPFAVYAIYLYNVMIALRRWKKGDRDKFLSERKAHMLFVPLQFGGCGIGSMITLAGSLAGPTLPEQVGMMMLIGYRFLNVRPVYERILAAKKVPSSKSSKVYDPSNIITVGRRLRSDRFTVLLEKAITNKVRSPVVKALLGPKTNDNVGFVEQALAEGADLPVPLREVIRDSERDEVIKKLAKKFLTARSALVFIRGRDLARVAMKNRTEAAAVVNGFF